MLWAQVHEVTNTDIYGTLFVFALVWIGQLIYNLGKLSEFKREVSEKITELKTDIEHLNETVQERILPRQEYENRHSDLKERVSSLEKAVYGRRKYDTGEHHG